MLLSPRKSALHWSLLGIAVLLFVPRIARAHLTVFHVVPTTSTSTMKSESPTFGGHTFNVNGQDVQYEKIVGTACGELDPADPKNAVIVDLALAPRTPPAAGTTCAHPATTCANSNGCVQYSVDFYILKPIDLSKGAHKVMYEPPNRGNKTWATLGRFPGGNDPGSVTDAATLDNAFFMPRGYTIVFSGWDQAAGTNNANFVTTISLPVAHYPEGTPGGTTITGPAYDYLVTASLNGTTSTLTYTPRDLTQGNSLNDNRSTGAAILTHRVHLDDVPTVIDSSLWFFSNSSGTQIKLNPAAITAGHASKCVVNNVVTSNPCFVPNDIYEVMYTAQNPTVNTVGLAAIRDFNAWLRYESVDSVGNQNPLAGDIRRIYTEVVSQPGRTLNDFRHLGFNQAENGKKVFDGMLQWIAAGDGLSMNFRFSQPGRTERNRQDHLFNEATFPFANVMTTDPITGQRDSRLARCEMSHTCPVSMEIYSANEYWVKAASLLHTTPDGKHDLPDSPFARNYFISSHMHGSAPLNADGKTTGKGNCQQMQNPLNSAPIQRALWIAMDEWVEHHKEPPRSRVPTFHDQTLVTPDQASTGFPHIPGVTYTGLKTTRYRFNWGNGSNGPFYNPSSPKYGIPEDQPPINSDGVPIPFGTSPTSPYEDNPKNGPIYLSFVPKTDEDGNDIAGIRLGDVRVPVATYTGWALRSGPQANDGCESSGQFIPFAQKPADRAPGDPRVSTLERYGTLQGYADRVGQALRKMIHERVLLCEDFVSERDRLIALGMNVGGLPGTVSNPPALPKSCTGHGDHDDDDDD